MIKLSSKINHNFKDLKPFATRVNLNLDNRTSNQDSFIKKDENKIIIETSRGTAEILDNTLNIEDKEIILFYPKVETLKRFYRPSANSNSLLLTELCDQRCIMCSQPPKNKSYDDFSLYKEAIFLMPDNAHLGITGGEPTLFKEPLFNFLKQIIKKKNEFTFHILTNAQHFLKEDINNLFLLSKNVTWGIPLYSHESKAHDDIVSKDGAFHRLFESFNYLLSSGSQVELRTVLMKQNVDHLTGLSNLISTKLSWIRVWAIMQLENIGYARMNWKKIFFDNSEDFSEIEKSISILQSNNINLSLYNFPFCTVPKDFRKYAKNSISDWKNKYLDECNNCKKQKDCCGFFEWHKNDIGYKNIGTKFL